VKRGRSIASLGRAPVPEWEEVARAAWPGRLPQQLVTPAGAGQLALLIVSIFTLVLAAWLRLPWLGLAAWTLGALGEWLATPADSPIARLMDLVGLRYQVRALVKSLIVSALIFRTVAEPYAGLAYVVVVLFAQLAWSVQPVLSTWLWRSSPPLRYQPDAAAQPASLAAHVRLYARGVGYPAILLLIEFIALAKALAADDPQLGAFGSVVAIGALLVAATLVYLAWAFFVAQKLRAGQRSAGDSLLAELAGPDPVFVIYVSLAARQSKYIVNQWLPAFDAQPCNGIIVVREASQLAPLAATRHPVVYAPTTRHVESLVLPSVRAAFYLAYGEKNSNLLRDPNLIHVMLAHGDSDKATSASALVRIFDETWVAGQAGVDRFAKARIPMAPERFAVIGRPQVSGLPVGPTGQEPVVILYAPTFEGYYEQTTHSSLDTMGVDLVRRLLADRPEVQVWFRPHPSSGVLRPTMLTAIDTITDLLKAAPGGHLVSTGGGSSITECLVRADVLVSDVSSVVSDYLQTERPVIVCDPDGLSADEFAQRYPSQAGSYRLTPGLPELDVVLADALGADPLHARRLEMKHYVLGDPPGGPQAAFAANVARVTSGS
jgi:hypothetical protein